MKQYRFDYIKENVDKWNPSVPRDVATIESLPFWVSLPWLTLDEYIPPKDYYGEVVEDFDEWYNQRHEYCVKLAKEYKKQHDYRRNKKVR